MQSGTEDTAAAQQPAVQAAIQARAAGIVIAGNDPDALCPALKQAQAAGTHVIAFDSDVNCRELFINQADTETIGRSQIALLAKLIDSDRSDDARMREVQVYLARSGRAAKAEPFRVRLVLRDGRLLVRRPRRARVRFREGARTDGGKRPASLCALHDVR